MAEADKTFPLSGKSSSKNNPEHQALLRALWETRDRLNSARVFFNNVSDPELVEASVYEINALQARHSYLLRRLKEENVTDSTQVLR